ncbi:hypothetical protein BDZ91DRAFT_796805 [Kalaharituber pfeilii]|nr:hypothetical protein BDZ91DRAFT_796805 [Kalaharituber pfeilii]
MLHNELYSTTKGGAGIVIHGIALRKDLGKVRQWLEAANKELGKVKGIRWLRKRKLLEEEGKKTSSVVIYLEKEVDVEKGPSASTRCCKISSIYRYGLNRQHENDRMRSMSQVWWVPFNVARYMGMAMRAQYTGPFGRHENGMMSVISYMWAQSTTIPWQNEVNFTGMLGLF